MNKAAKTGPKGPTTIDGQVGLRIRHIRIQQKISQEALGDKLGVSFQQIQKYEKGINRLSLSRAIEVAKALSTTVNELAGLNGGSKVGEVTFDHAAYKLSLKLGRLEALSAALAGKFGNLIESVCEDLESNGRKKR